MALTNNTVCFIPESPRTTASAWNHLWGWWLKWAACKHGLLSKTEAFFQEGGNKMGLGGERKHSEHCRFLHAVITQCDMFFTSRKGKWRVDLWKKHLDCNLLSWANWYVWKTSYSSSCSSPEDKRTWAYCSDPQTSWFCGSFYALKITEDAQRALFMWATSINIYHNRHKAEKF